MIPKRIILLLCLICSLNLFSQQKELNYEAVKKKVEDLAEQFEIEMDYADFIDNLFYYSQNPLNLNDASEEQLRSLGLLNELQIANLLDYRKKRGLLVTIYELKDIDGFDYLFAYELQTFVYVGPIKKTADIKLTDIVTRGRHDLIIRYSQILENQAGFIDTTDSRYLGSPQKYYFRYRYNYRDMFSFGLLGDKDAGEEFFKGSNKNGFDFYSFHLYYKSKGMIKSVALGDYHVEFGQGLTLWSGLGFGKSVDALGTQKNARGLRPNTSSNENLFMRGAAVAISPWEPLTGTFFYSRKKLDAGLETDTLNSDESYFSSLQESGYHRTINELSKRRSVLEQIIGANLKYSNKGLVLGYTTYYTLYGSPLIKETELYQIYDFQGDRNYNMGIDFAYSYKRFGVFGEASMSKNTGKAVLLGLVANLHPRLKMSMTYRNYSPEYQVFYAAPFAEASGAHNEMGLYTGFKAYIGRSSSLTAYYDFFSFPWLRYRVDEPSQGQEFFVEYHKEVTRDFEFYTRLRSETKMLNQSGEEAYIYVPQPVNKQSMRLNATYSIDSRFRLQSRFEVVRYVHQPDPENYGYLIFQDLKCQSKKYPIDFSLRYALFNTDSYDARLYAYESDVLYKFSIPGYYYHGQRYYLMFHWDVSNRIDFWARFAQTVYFDQEIIGSGQDEITGNKKSEITVQMRFKF